MVKWAIVTATVVFYLVMFSGCASVPKTSAIGKIGVYPVNTSVDSFAAKYYLEQYLLKQFTSPALDQKISAELNQKEITYKSLQELSQTFSPDFATLFLANTLLNQSRNRQVQLLFQQELLRARNGESMQVSVGSTTKESYLVLFVPGWDYVYSGAKTGADFDKPRQLLSEMGVRNHLIEINPIGSVEGNAHIVADRILSFANTGENVLIVSASSGSPAVALALGEILTSSDVSHVAGWLNIGGILRGSPVIDHYQQWPQRFVFNVFTWIQGWDTENIATMSEGNLRARFEQFEFPKTITIVNYIGIPLSGHITPRAKDGYEILRQIGPNDGLTMILDEIVPDAPTIVSIGFDHFLNEDPEIDLKTVALTRTMLRLLTHQRPELKQARFNSDMPARQLSMQLQRN